MGELFSKIIEMIGCFEKKEKKKAYPRGAVLLYINVEALLSLEEGSKLTVEVDIELGYQSFNYLQE